MEGEDIIEAQYCLSELGDMALGKTIEPPSFDLNAKPLDSLDVDETFTYCETSKCSTSCSNLNYIFVFMDNLVDVTFGNALKLHAWLEKLNKIYVVDLKCQH